MSHIYNRSEKWTRLIVLIFVIGVGLSVGLSGFWLHTSIFWVLVAAFFIGDFVKQKRKKR